MKNKLDIEIQDKTTSNITFHGGDSPEPILELKANGDILIRGKKTINDMEVVDGLREFLIETGHIKRL